MLNEKHHKGMELGDLRSWQEDKFYQLDRPNMGHCYIINNVDREQPATRRDVDQLEKTFSGLGTIGRWCVITVLLTTQIICINLQVLT